jgi:hypothetical protein
LFGICLLPVAIAAWQDIDGLILPKIAALRVGNDASVGNPNE